MNAQQRQTITTGILIGVLLGLGLLLVDAPWYLAVVLAGLAAGGYVWLRGPD